MLRRHLLVGAALLALAPFALAGDKKDAPAAAAAPAAPAGDPKIPFERYKLPNGLEIILSADKSVPLVAVNVWYHVGSGYEVPGKSGFAHLFEHMMFQGSKNVGEDRHFDILKKIGAEQINGTTNTDRTNYYEVVPSNQLETALWLESDRMGHLLELLTKPSLDNQIDVVRNERRQSYDNRPYGKALFAEYEGLYPVGHPYRYLTIGKHEDLVAASVDDVKGFFRTWYVPANATIAIVGDIDIPATKQLVDKWFAAFPKSVKPAVVSIAAPAGKAATATVEDSFAKLRQITFAWHSPAKYKDGDAELAIAADALDTEGPGRLYKTLVYEKQLAQSVGVGQDGKEFSGVFQITVTLRSEANLDEVKKIVMDTVAQLAKEPLADKEIARVVGDRENRAVFGLESVFGRSQTLQQYNHFVGDPDKLSWDLDRYRHATPTKIRDVVATYLRPDAVVTVITLPAAAKEGAK